MAKQNDIATPYEECPHCGIHEGEHHTECPNHAPNVAVRVNVLGWERVVTAYLYPDSWGLWCDRPPIPLETLS